MNTIISDWSIVSIIDDNGLKIGDVLWGIVIDDSSCRFLKNDYVCSSKIVKVYHQLITTNSGSIYQVIGNGVESEINFSEFELLRHGFSPKQIKDLRLSSGLKIH
jgi:hypothetical protein